MILNGSNVNIQGTPSSANPRTPPQTMMQFGQGIKRKLGVGAKGAGRNFFADMHHAHIVFQQCCCRCL